MQYLLGFGQNPQGPQPPQPAGPPTRQPGQDLFDFIGQHKAWQTGQSQATPGGLGGPTLQGFNQPPVATGSGPTPNLTPLGDAFNFSGGVSRGTSGLGGPQVQPFPGGQLANQSGPAGRIESIFGPTGVQATPLQRQAGTGISQYLNQPSPETRTLDALSPGLMNLFSQSVGAAGGQPQNVLPPEVMRALTGLATGQNAGAGAGVGVGGGGLGQEGTDFLRNLLKQPAGQGVIDALNPTFQRNLAEANQAGGRFGTANAVMRSRALEDFNLLAAQAAQRGTDQQLDAANRLAQLGISSGAASGNLQGAANAQQLAAVDALIRAGLGGGQLGLQAQQQGQQGALGAGGLLQGLAGQSGGADFNRLLQGYGVGSQQAQQNDVGTSRNLGILMNILGQMNQATLGAPTQTTPSGFQQGAGLGGQIGQILALLAAQKGGGGGSFPGAGAFGGAGT